MAQATGRAGWRLQRPPLEALSREDAARLMGELDRIGFSLQRAA